jgi:hypothetical protein
MPGAYESVLPEVFPYSMNIHADYITYITEILSAGREGAPYGSSFAVTSEPGGDMRRVYLSGTSYRTIRDRGDILILS